MRRNAGRMAAAIGLAGSLLGRAPVTADVWYVDAGAPPGGSGQSWPTAFRFLQDALFHPDLAAGDEIRVAAGTYYPDLFAGDTEGGDPEWAFELPGGIRYYGGFPPGGGGWAERDVAAHETILSGEISEPPDYSQFTQCTPPQPDSGDCFTATPGVPGCNDPECCALVCDTLGICCMNEWPPGCAAAAADICTSHRSIHVVTIGTVYLYGGGGPVRLDGFTISGGAALVADDDSDPYAANNRDVGGGVYGAGGNTVIVNCTIEANRARTGGGGAYGGGHFVNCRFIANRAADGGAIYAPPGGHATFVNCVFLSNTALPGSGGAAWVGASGEVEMVNCLFLDNLALGHGSACYQVPVIRSSIVWGNGTTPLFGGSVTYSLVEQGDPGQGNIAGPPMFVSPITGDFRLSWLSPCIDAGSGAALPGDAADLDGDLDLAEPTPLDLGALPRLVNGTVDMGPYEYCAFDLVADGVVDVQDLLAFLGAWGAAADGPPDFDGNGSVNVSDLLALLGSFGPCS